MSTRNPCARHTAEVDMQLLGGVELYGEIYSVHPTAHELARWAQVDQRRVSQGLGGLMDQGLVESYGLPPRYRLSEDGWARLRGDAS